MVAGCAAIATEVFRPSSEQLSQPGDASNLTGRHDQMLVVAPDPKFRAPLDVLVLRFCCGFLVDPYIQHMHALVVLTVVAPYIRARAVGFDDDRDAM